MSMDDANGDTSLEKSEVVSEEEEDSEYVPEEEEIAEEEEEENLNCKNEENVNFNGSPEDDDYNQSTGRGNDGAFDLNECPECGRPLGKRPVKEICGHVKCQGCYIDSSSDDTCKQCQVENESDLGSPPHLSPQCDHPLEPEPTTTALDVRPGELVFQLDSSSSSTLAVVSVATLKELGITPDVEEGFSAPTSATITIPLPPALTLASSLSQSPSQPSTCCVPPPATESVAVSISEQTSESVEHIEHLPPSKLVAETPPSPPSPPTRKGKTKSKQKPVLKSRHIKPVDSTHFKCGECSKVFTTEYNRKWHVYCDKTNGPRPFICECKEEFISQSHYLYHIRVKHTGEKPYKCAVCDMGFVQKVKLNRHMIRHTTMPRPKPPPKTPGTLFVCAFCEKSFTLMAQIKRHMVIHTEERPYGCDKCDKRFKQHSGLVTHIKTHSNNRPFACQEPGCRRAFQIQKDLKRHSLIHTGEQPFICNYGSCNAQFRRKDNLERHIRGTHRLSEQIAKIMGAEAQKKWDAEKERKKNEGNASNKKKVGMEVITGL